MVKKVAVLIKKVVEMVELDLGQIVIYEVVKHAEKVHVRHLLPFHSLIFQVIVS